MPRSIVGTREASAAPRSGSGLFIALEGVEGCGKTTQTRLLAEWLSARRVPHTCIREPGGTPIGEEVRRLLLDSADVPTRAELLLMLAARAVLVETVVRPALERGEVVLTDRFELSTFAYQGHGRSLPLSEVRGLNRFATAGLTPDLTIVLDVAPETGEARRARAGRGADRIEQAGRVFHVRVAEGYRRLSREEPNVERVDGSLPVQEVHAQVLSRLHEHFTETFAPPKG